MFKVHTVINLFHLRTWPLLVLLLFVAGVGHAQQPSQTVRGTVVDKDTKTPLFGVNVVITDVEPMQGASTDGDGRFRIEQVPVGRRTIAVTAMGYEPATLPNVLIGSGKEVVLNIELLETVTRLKEVTISATEDKATPNNEMASVSARSFSVEETKRYAAAINDPSRMALNFAGVTANNDASNEIIIRGNSPKGLLWRLEGVEIPNPNHFAEEGSSGGGVSILSAQMLTQSDFFTGAFPAEYGNALSGVFDIRLRKGNNEKREFTFQGGFLGLDLAAEGPFTKGKRSSFLVNYRYSTLAVFNALGINIVGDVVPTFQDLSFNLAFPTKNAGNFNVWGIGGLSQTNMDENVDPSTFFTNMAATGVSHYYPLTKRTYLRTVLATTGTQNVFRDEARRASGEFFLTDEEAFYNGAVRATTTLTTKLNSQHLFKFGGIYSRLLYWFRSSEFNFSQNSLITLLDESGGANLLQGFGAWQYRPSRTVTINSGLHWTYLDLSGRYALEPRLGLRWQVATNKTLSAAVGIHSRVENIPTYFTNSFTVPQLGIEVFPNRALKFSKAAHYVLGYEWLLGTNLRMKLEGYYQQLYDVPIEWGNSIVSLINEDGTFTSTILVNEGTGTNYGGEMTLERFFANHYYFLMTLSLYESKYVPGNGQTYDTRFNGNHSFNFLCGREFPVGKGRNNTFGANIRFNWNGGVRFTPVNLEASRFNGTTIRDWSRPYADQAPDYLRLDLQANYRRNREKTTHEWRLDIQNATNRANELELFYDPELGTTRANTQLGLIPVLSYRVEF